MATGDIKLKYVASSALTFTAVNSLASSATFVAGAESTAVDNSSNLYIDYLLTGHITAGTTPTASKEIRVYVIGIENDTTWPDVLDGTDSAETITNTAILDSIGKLAAVMVPSTVSAVVYNFGPISIASLFGGVVPLKFVVYVAHSTVAAFPASGHLFSITPVYETVSA